MARLDQLAILVGKAVNAGQTCIAPDTVLLIGHSRDAFAAADFTMDHLKSDSWFWKREKADGAWRWVEPRAQDHADLARWAAPAPN